MRTDDVKPAAHPTCGECFHAHPIPETLGQGCQCRHGPIQAIAIPGVGITAVYPPVQTDCIACSQFKPKGGPNEKTAEKTR